MNRPENFNYRPEVKWQKNEVDFSGGDYPEVPMDEHREEIAECVRDHKSSVIVGETGSGKTTRIPEFLMDEFPDARIAITQPRRVAARSVSKYVAERRGQEVGGEVGYQVRFDDQTTEGTRANFMTDGILLRKLQMDPLLEEFDIVMVDEAHERNLNIDFVLGLLKRVQAERQSQGRKELKIVVTSATIEKKKFSDYFGEAPTIEVEGRMHPVDVSYEPVPVEKYPAAAAQKVNKIVSSREPGDVLIFMPGEEEADLLMIESTGKFSGVYFILGGTVGMFRKEDLESLRLVPLKQIIKRGNLNEIIVALNPTPEGKTTAIIVENAIKEVFPSPTFKITHLAQGIPVGGELEYADEETLQSALEGRK